MQKQANNVNLVNKLPQYAVWKSFDANCVVLEVLVTHVTYRATVTATLHVGPHECKDWQTVSKCQFGQDMTYLTIICSLEKFPCGIRGIGRTRYI